METHSQERHTSTGTHLGRDRGSGSRQTSVAWKSSVLGRDGCGLNRGQGYQTIIHTQQHSQRYVVKNNIFRKGIGLLYRKTPVQWDQNIYDITAERGIERREIMFAFKRTIER